MPKKNDVITINLNDPNWRAFSKKHMQELGILSNQLQKNAAEGLGVLVAYQGSYTTWALNKAGLEHLLAADQAGRINGYVVLATRTSGTVTTIAVKPVAEVAAALANVPPRTDGEFGDYWWVGEDFRPDGQRVLADDEAF
jgi:hypothetical protein